MIKNRKSLAVATALFVFALFISQCIQNKPTPDPRGTAFAPQQSCRQCHRAIYDSAILSAHAQASVAASAKNVLGSFQAGHNSFIYDSSTRIRMEERDSGLYQVLYNNGKAMAAHRFDIGFGVKHAQTWLYWQDDQAFELPISFYTGVNAWATSPGFSAVIPNFNRLIGMDCFECHSSYISSKKNAEAGNYFATESGAELLDKNSLVPGIDCQRCHGPAAEHVNYQLQYPEIKTAKFIITGKSLSRQQQLDQCAVCHSGNDKRKLRSRFLFRPGDNLADFFLPSVVPDSLREFDVHGNQFNLLKQSKCFLRGNSMTCITCHDPHVNANQPLALYTQKCMGCHNEAAGNFCTVTPAPGMLLQDNCIDCHMPKQASNAISFQLSGSTAASSYILRSHRIAVYKAETKNNTRAKK